MNDAVLTRLNRLAQGTLPMDEGERWFRGCDASTQVAVLGQLAHCVVQAGARHEEVQRAVEESGVGGRTTATRTLLAHPVKDAVWKATRLGDGERGNVFRLLVTLLAVADSRRRRDVCGTSCSHWWHHLDELVE
jgi:hypothetical protein